MKQKEWKMIFRMMVERYEKLEGEEQQEKKRGNRLHGRVLELERENEI